MRLVACALMIATTSTFAARPAVDAVDRERDLAAIRVVAIREALRMAADRWNGTLVYVSVDTRVDPSAKLLKALEDGTHSFKKASACPRKHWPGIGDLCHPEKGAVEVWVGEVAFVGEDLAEAMIAFGFGPTSGLACPHRFRRLGEGWAMVPSTEFIGPCMVS